MMITTVEEREKSDVFRSVISLSTKYLVHRVLRNFTNTYSIFNSNYVEQIYIKNLPDGDTQVTIPLYLCASSSFSYCNGRKNNSNDGKKMPYYAT